ncbi:MAG: site-specific integrase [Deltaproteobacteria bacterium]
MVGTLTDRIKGVRDRALLILGFACAFRRSELVSLNLEDLNFTADGLEVTLRSSKTDQERAGVKIGVPYGGHPGSCPVRSVQAWLRASGIVTGPMFRPIDRHGNVSSQRLSPEAVATVVKVHAGSAGLDPRRYAGHSLRAGLITAAVRAGKSEALVMRQCRHKSVSVFRTYVRDADLFRENAAAGIGL